MSAAITAQRAVAALIRENAQLKVQAEEQAAALQEAIRHLTRLELDLDVYRAAARATAVQDVPPLRLVAGGRSAEVAP